jgi:hypothetical protein
LASDDIDGGRCPLARKHQNLEVINSNLIEIGIFKEKLLLSDSLIALVLKNNTKPCLRLIPRMEHASAFSPRDSDFLSPPDWRGQGNHQINNAEINKTIFPTCPADDLSQSLSFFCISIIIAE